MFGPPVPDGTQSCKLTSQTHRKGALQFLSGMLDRSLQPIYSRKMSNRHTVSEQLTSPASHEDTHYHSSAFYPPPIQQSAPWSTLPLPVDMLPDDTGFAAVDHSHHTAHPSSAQQLPSTYAPAPLSLMASSVGQGTWCHHVYFDQSGETIP